jgi:hypothetical protein
MKKSALLSFVAFCMYAFGGLNAQEQAKPANVFVESIGIGNCFDWLNYDGTWGYAQTGLSSLKNRHVRAGIGTQSESSVYTTNIKNLASAMGVKLCIISKFNDSWRIQ